MVRQKFTPANLKKFAWFNAGGLVFFVSGYSLFALLYGVFSWHWFPAKALADLTGWTLNYLIQQYLAFDGRARGHRQILKKFIPFSLVNLGLDYALVGGLKLLGVSPFLGLWISSLFFTVWKWLGYNHWVFKQKL